MTTNQCIKCTQSGDVHIRRTWYCQKCFMDLLKLKFDTAMGQSTQKRLEAKVLLCLDESASSSMLLDLSQKYLLESSLLAFKKRSFHIRELLVAQNPNFEPISKDSIVLPVLNEFPELSDSWKSCTSKKDFEQIVTFRMFADLAIENKCSALLLPDTCTDLAIRSICDTALGKGISLAQNITPFLVIDHKGHSLLIVRPLHDVTDADVMHYNRIKGLKESNVARNDKGSIQGATRDFLSQLEEEHPSTINIITKTCLKLPQKHGDGLCMFCKCPRLDSDSGWRQNHILKSKLPWDSEGSEESSCVPSLCYSCQNILIDINNDDKVDKKAFIKRIKSSSEIGREINEFLL